MKRVTALGGVFFKARDPAALSAWYRGRFGWAIAPEGNKVELWQPTTTTPGT